MERKKQVHTGSVCTCFRFYSAAGVLGAALPGAADLLRPRPPRWRRRWPSARFSPFGARPRALAAAPWRGCAWRSHPRACPQACARRICGSAGTSGAAAPWPSFPPAPAAPPSGRSDRRRASSRRGRVSGGAGAFSSRRIRAYVHAPASCRRRPHPQRAAAAPRDPPSAPRPAPASVGP